MSDGGLMPLSFMGPGESGVLAQVHGLRHHHHQGDETEHAGPVKTYRRAHMYHADRGHRLEHRLKHMGLIPGATVEIVKNSLSGPVIVRVGETRLGLARGVASRIMVDTGAGRPGAGG